MNAGAERLATRLEAAARAGAEVNLFRLLGAMALDVVGTAAFGCALSVAGFQGLGCIYLNTVQVYNCDKAVCI